MAKTNDKVLSKKIYNELLDAIDTLSIESIISEIKKLKDADNVINLSDLFWNYNTTELVEIDGVSKEESNKIQRQLEGYTNISSNINFLSRHTGSIRTYFTNFPWDAVGKMGELLHDAITKKDLSLYNNYKDKFDLDLDELETWLKFIVQAISLKKPAVSEILYDFKDARKDIFDSLDFIDSEDINPRGLNHIRQAAELALDEEKKIKILDLISKAEACDSESAEGRAALFSITVLIGEISKDISLQTKLLNNTIPFKELKDFRNKIHDIDSPDKAKKLFNLVETDKAVFLEIKDFLVNNLINKISGLKMPSLVDSSPKGATSPLPRITPTSGEEIDCILDIIKQAFPIPIRASDSVKLKLGICKDILSGKLPIPLVDKKNQGKFNLQNFLIKVFKDELAGEKFFKSAIYKHCDDNAESRKKAEQSIEKLEEFLFSDIYKYQFPKSIKDPSQQVGCLKKFEFNTKKQAQSTIIYTNEQQEKYYIEKQLDILINALEKINQDTQSVMININDYQEARLQFSDPQFHFSHLYYLIVIGQAIQNLVGKELFLQSATSELLAEFDFLKWVRNGLMHDLDINETGSALNYFGNDLLNLSIRDHGAKAYDTDAYLMHLKPQIEQLLSNIKNNIKLSDTDTNNQFYRNLLLKRLEIADDNKEFKVELLILKVLGEQEKDEGTKYIKNKVAKLLSKAHNLPLEELYANKDNITSIATKYGIKLVGFFGSIVNKIGTYQNNSGIYLEGEVADKTLMLLKKELQKLLNYRFMIITDKHLKEKLSVEIDFDYEYKKFLDQIYEKNSYEKVINGIGMHLAINQGWASDEVIKLGLHNCNLDLWEMGYTPLYKAYDIGRMDIVKLLLEAGANVNEIYLIENEETLLHKVIDDLHNEENYYKAIDFIMNAKELRLIQEPFWNINPLHLLAYCKFKQDITKVATKLIQNATEEELNQVDGYGKTALLEAIEQNNLEVANLLLSNPLVDINIVRQEPINYCAPYIPKGLSPLAAAVILDRAEILETMLTRKDIKIEHHPYIFMQDNEVFDQDWPLYGKNIEFNNGSTIFHMAVALGNIGALKLLLHKFGSQVLLLTDYLGKTLLHTACRYDQNEIVKLLLDKDQLDSIFAENGGDINDEIYAQFINAKDRYANTASASIHLPHSLFMKYTKIFLENKFFDGNTLEGSHGKSIIGLVLENQKNEELIELAKSKQRESHYQIPKCIIKKLYDAFENSWFGETVTLNGVGIDDLIKLYCTKKTITTTGSYNKSILDYEIQINNLSDETRKEELIETIKYAFVSAHNVENLQFSVTPEWIDMELLKSLNEIIYENDYYEDECEIHIATPVEASIKMTKISESDQMVTEKFEITHEGLMDLLGSDNNSSDEEWD